MRGRLDQEEADKIEKRLEHERAEDAASDDDFLNETDAEQLHHLKIIASPKTAPMAKRVAAADLRALLTTNYGNDRGLAKYRYLTAGLDVADADGTPDPEAERERYKREISNAWRTPIGTPGYLLDPAMVKLASRLAEVNPQFSPPIVNSYTPPGNPDADAYNRKLAAATRTRTRHKNDAAVSGEIADEARADHAKVTDQAWREAVERDANAWKTGAA